MNTIIEKLNKLKGTKEAIRLAINNKGGTLTKTDKLSDYAPAINNLTIGGGSGSGSVDIMKPVYSEQKDPVPNTGHLEKIFFNTKLDPAQVDALIANANLTFISDSSMPVYPILMTNTGKVISIFDVSSQSGVESGSAWLIADLNSDATYYVSPALAPDDPTYAGWIQNSFTSYDTGEIAIDAELVQEMEGITIGSQNNLLTDLVRLYSLIDSGETELAKSLTGQYNLVEKNIVLDSGTNTQYIYDFISNINEDTKEIDVIKNIKADTKENNIIDRSVTTYTNSKVKKIGKYAFYRCTSLTDVSFPNAVTIDEYAFSICEKLANVNIPLVARIGRYAFDDCVDLEELNLPQVTDIFNNAFSHCGLVSINIPLVTVINSNTFESCMSLKNITAPLVERIEASAFYYCTQLESVTFPEVRYVYEGAFNDDRRLKEVYLPKVAYIKAEAFRDCASLVKLFISRTDRVCDLALADAFKSCSHILGKTDSIYNPNGLKDGYIYVPASLLSQYKVAKN